MAIKAYPRKIFGYKSAGTMFRESKIQFCLQFHTEYDTIYLYLYG